MKLILQSIHFLSDQGMRKAWLACAIMMMVVVTQVSAASATNTVSVAAEQQTVSGTVVDAQGNKLPGVNVMVAGTNQGVTTNAQGQYSLSVPAGASLEFSFIGFTKQTLPVGASRTLNVTLAEDTQKINEVVVVGYGTQKRSEVTASVASLREDAFNTAAAPSSVLELAKGKLPGVVITNTNGGDPRSAASVQIRGASSIKGGNGPLIVIDGVPGGSLTSVQPDDISGFDVLKDAAAAAIYGTRGANGVILITTKRAKKGEREQARFDYSGYASHDYMYRTPEILTAQEYRDYMNSGDYNSNLMKDWGGEADWMDLITNKSNFSHSHNLAVTGGGAKTGYRASIFYRENSPISKGSDQTQWGGRMSINHLGFNDKLELNMSISANFRTRNNVAGNGMFEQAAQRNPTENAKDENGNWIEDNAYNSSNPLREMELTENTNTQTMILANASATVHILEGFKGTVMGAWQQSDALDNQYRYMNSKSSTDSYEGGGYARKGQSQGITKTLEATLDYSKTWGDHSFNALAGYSYQYSVSQNFNAENMGFLTDGFLYNNLGNGTYLKQGKAGMGSGKSDNTLIAFFGRVNYSFKSRYQLSATLRHEGSSRFGKNNKWGNFPAVSAGWVISQEEFMSNVDWVNNLKIRAGFGVTGNQDIENYASLVSLGTGGQYPIGGLWYQTYGPGRNPNPNLKWEKKEELNIGVEFSLFNDRLSGSVEWYDRTTKDLLYDYNAQLPPFVQSTILTNVGQMDNSGVEVGLSGVIIQNKNFTWTMDGVFSYQKNILTSLSNETYKASYYESGGLPSPGALGNASRTVEGGPMGEFYGKRFAGFDENGKWLFYNKNNEKVTVAQVKDDDKTWIGNGTPKYYASLTNTLRYKGFDLTVFFRGKFDFDALNLKELYFGNRNWLPNNVLKSALTRHKDLKDAPQYSDYYLEKGDFVKLDNVTLGYNFKIKPNNYIRNVRVYVSGQNLATITGYTGTSPELQDTGLSTGIESRSFYPNTSTIMVGLNIGF